MKLNLVSAENSDKSFRRKGVQAERFVGGTISTLLPISALSVMLQMLYEISSYKNLTTNGKKPPTVTNNSGKRNLEAKIELRSVESRRVTKINYNRLKLNKK